MNKSALIQQTFSDDFFTLIQCSMCFLYNSEHLGVVLRTRHHPLFLTDEKKNDTEKRAR